VICLLRGGAARHPRVGRETRKKLPSDDGVCQHHHQTDDGAGKLKSSALGHKMWCRDASALRSGLEHT
jgi:hypothetical protein